MATILPAGAQKLLAPYYGKRLERLDFSRYVFSSVNRLELCDSIEKSFADTDESIIYRVAAFQKEEFALCCAVAIKDILLSSVGDQAVVSLFSSKEGAIAFSTEETADETDVEFHVMAWGLMQAPVDEITVKLGGLKYEL